MKILFSDVRFRDMFFFNSKGEVFAFFEMVRSVD
jgi:hypothetical protein